MVMAGAPTDATIDALVPLLDPGDIVVDGGNAHYEDTRRREQALRARGLPKRRIMLHVLRNAAPTVLAVAGLQFGQMLGGSILIETVFAWPGTGFLLNAAIFQRDLPLLQGSILVLAMFFVALNLIVDVVQTALDPRIERG